MSLAAEAASSPITTPTPVALTPGDFLPAAVSVVAVLTAIFVQHAVIGAAQRWRER